jgi:hypothetical protein
MRRIVCGFLVVLAGISNSFAERIDLKLTGQQGDYYLFTIPKDNLTKEYALHVINGICSNKKHCFVMIWQKGQANPKKIPLTDKEVKLLAVNYRQNEYTNLKKIYWDCKRFPETPKDECWSGGS